MVRRTELVRSVTFLSGAGTRPTFGKGRATEPRTHAGHRRSKTAVTVRRWYRRPAFRHARWPQPQGKTNHGLRSKATTSAFAGHEQERAAARSVPTRPKQPEILGRVGVRNSLNAKEAFAFQLCLDIDDVAV